MPRDPRGNLGGNALDLQAELEFRRASTGYRDRRGVLAGLYGDCVPGETPYLRLAGRLLKEAREDLAAGGERRRDAIDWLNSPPPS